MSGSGDPIRVTLVGPSLDILGGQAVQASRLLARLRECPELRVEFVPITPRLQRPRLTWSPKLESSCCMTSALREHSSIRRHYPQANLVLEEQAPRGEQLATRARARVQEWYSWPAVERQWLGLYRDLAGRDG